MRRLLLRLVGGDTLLAEITSLAALTLLLEDELSATRSREESTRRLLNVMLEPPQNNSCQKIRLRSRTEADSFARRVEKECGADKGSLEPYRCPSCPRQPVSMARFWHVRHVDKAKRGLGSRQYARTRPHGLGHLSPDQVALLKTKVEDHS